MAAKGDPMAEPAEAQKYTSFAEFWPHYVREHAHRQNRRLHFIGTGLGLANVALAVGTGNLFLALLSPIFGYGMAWIGHFFLQRNTPATFQYPLWSLFGDFKMFGLMLLGRMDSEVESALRAVRGARAGSPPP
jgi:hypothetical protein